MPARLGELAVRFGCELQGDPAAVIDSVATLQDAGAGSITFLANTKYRKHLATTGATAVVLDAASAALCHTNALVAANPYATYARIAGFLNPEPSFAGGQHPSAVIEAGARIDATAWIGAGCYVGRDADIGPGAFIGPGSIVLERVRIGASTRLAVRVTVYRDVRIGERCLLHAGVVIGADGFGHAPDKNGYVKIPQLGTVVIGDDVEIGANSTIDRGAIGDTIIERGVKIDNQVQVAHNVRIGEHTVIAGCVGIAGSAVIGKRCMLGGMAGVVGHVEICDDVYLTGKTMVNTNITQPGLYSGQLPYDEAQRFRRNSARFRHFDELAQRVRRLERAAGVTRQDASHDDVPADDTQTGDEAQGAKPA
jgi:UDP-3-O-[3-hydroxymyristoyl] glucosamine N-acyltransferase